MRVLGMGFLMVTCGLAGLALWFRLLSEDLLLYFHLMYADYPDPSGHGLKGVVVTTPQLFLEVSAAVACTISTGWLAKSLRDPVERI